MLLSLAYIRLLLGPSPDKETFGDFNIFAAMLYYYGMGYLVLAVGGSIALIYILFDHFYLKNKLKDNPKKTKIRFLFILVIAVVVAIIHYVLEKVVDII